jgi:hypothetical protein
MKIGAGMTNLTATDLNLKNSKTLGKSEKKPSAFQNNWSNLDVNDSKYRHRVRQSIEAL